MLDMPVLQPLPDPEGTIAKMDAREQPGVQTSREISGQARNRTTPPPQLERLLRRMGELPRGWNSYGAARISPWSIAEAGRIAREGMDTGLPVPAVTPGSGGSVGIEWRTGSAELIIDVDPRQGVTYLLVDISRGAETEGELNADNRPCVLRRAAGT